jgi:hypothetical protein
MKNFLFYTLFFALLLACNDTKTNQPQNQIEFIFKNYPQTEDDLSGKYLTNQPKIQLLDKDKTIVLSPKKANDTLLIKIENTDNLLLIHRFNTLSDLDIVLKNGDKVLIDYKGHFPSVQITNRKTLKYDTRIDSLILARYGDKKLSPLKVYVSPFVKFDLSIIGKIGLPAAKIAYLKLQKNYFDKSLLFLDKQQLMLDSLKIKHELSEEVHSIKFQTQFLKSSESQIDLPTFCSFLKSHQPSLAMKGYYKTLLETGYDTLMVKKQKTYFDFKDGVNREAV